MTGSMRPALRAMNGGLRIASCRTWIAATLRSTEGLATRHLVITAPAIGAIGETFQLYLAHLYGAGNSSQFHQYSVRPGTQTASGVQDLVLALAGPTGLIDQSDQQERAWPRRLSH
jgi:hypothetical protein